MGLIYLKTWRFNDRRRIYLNTSRNQIAKVWVERLPLRLSKDLDRDFQVKCGAKSSNNLHTQLGLPLVLNDNNNRPGWVINKMYDLWEEETKKTFTEFDELWWYVKKHFG